MYFTMEFDDHDEIEIIACKENKSFLENDYF